MRKVMALALALAALGAALPASAQAGAPKPKMRLKVSTHSGRAPMLLTLTGTIDGLDPARHEACLLTEEWTYTNPAGIPFDAKREIPCLEGENAPMIAASFKKDATLREPGRYSYRIVVVEKGGRRRASASQEVVLYRGNLEVELPGTNQEVGSPGL